MGRVGFGPSCPAPRAHISISFEAKHKKNILNKSFLTKEQTYVYDRQTDRQALADRFCFSSLQPSEPRSEHWSALYEPPELYLGGPKLPSPIFIVLTNLLHFDFGTSLADQVMF